MRLLDLTLENYRLHRHLRVEFAPDLTLIGGPNESGKSTLVEALHRVLFLRARGTSEEHRAMRPLSAAGGHPAVTLRFQARGQTWTLRKVFSGTNGTVSLSRPEETPLSAEPADERLAELLAVEGTAGGSRLALQWSHVWLWQGTASADPTDPDHNPSDKLAARLQAQSGGGDLLASPLDQHLLRHFTGETAKHFNANGAPVVRGPLGTLLEGVARARERDTAARARLSRYDDALRNSEDASSRLARLGTDFAALVREQSELKVRQDRLGELGAQQENEQTEAERLARIHQELLRHHEDIADRQARLESITTELAPLLAREDQFVALDSSAHAALQEAETRREAALAGAAQARDRHELLSAASVLQSNALRRTELEARADLRRNREEALAALRAELAHLPVLDSKLLAQLESLDRARLESLAGLKSLSTGIDVLNLDGPAFLADRALQPGESLELTDAAELRLGAGTRLRLRPGGGRSLDYARTAAQQAEQNLARALGQLALPDVESARTSLSARQIALERITAAERELDAPEFSRLDADLGAARESHAQAERRLELLRNQVPDCNVPLERGVLAQALTEAEIERRNQQAIAEEAARTLAAHREARETAQRDLSAHREKLASRRIAQNNLTIELGLLRQTHGEDLARTTRLAAEAAAAHAAHTKLQQTRAAIAELQPDVIHRAAERLTRAFTVLEQERSSQRERQLTAQTQLRSEGIEDPVSEAAEAKAALDRAEAELAAVQQDAEALRLLRDLYLGAQQALAERFTRPLLDRTRDYLRCLFGENVTVQVEHGPKGFSDLTISRADGPAVAFGSLSLGAREQVAAAFRLAAAEFLAVEHEGTLPMIFDDSFAYADPHRVRVLQNMLDLAASRGLQIVILSCNPGDYATLGARQFILSGPAVGGPSVAAPSRLPAPDQLEPEDEPVAEPNLPTLANPALPPSENHDSLREHLLAILRRARSSGDPFVSSRALRQELGCGQEEFNAIRDLLVSRQEIILEGRSQRLAP